MKSRHLKTRNRVTGNILHVCSDLKRNTGKIKKNNTEENITIRRETQELSVTITKPQVGEATRKLQNRKAPIKNNVNNKLTAESTKLFRIISEVVNK